MLAKVGVPEIGAKLTATFSGTLEADNVTVSIDPSRSDTVTVADMLFPFSTVPLVGLIKTEKSAGELTIRKYMVVLLKSPSLVPVIARA